MLHSQDGLWTGAWIRLTTSTVSIPDVYGRPGSSEVPRNPLIRWDVSSIPANGIFLTKKTKKQN